MFLSDALKQDIINLNYKSDIEEYLYLKKKYTSLGLTFESLSKLFIGISSMVSFSSIIKEDMQLLSFLAGSSSIMSLMLLQFSSYAFRESKNMNDEINLILLKLNISKESLDMDSSKQISIKTFSA